MEALKTIAVRAMFCAALTLPVPPPHAMAQPAGPAEALGQNLAVAAPQQNDAAAPEPGAQPPATGCELEPGPVRTVARVLDAETLQLDDGGEVRIIGALAPRARDAAAVPGEWPAEQQAIAPNRRRAPMF